MDTETPKKKTTTRTWCFGAAVVITVIIVAAAGGGKSTPTAAAPVAAKTTAVAPVSNPTPTRPTESLKESTAKAEANGWTGEQILEAVVGAEKGGASGTEAACDAKYVAAHYTPAEVKDAAQEAQPSPAANALAAACH